MAEAQGELSDGPEQLKFFDPPQPIGFETTAEDKTYIPDDEVYEVVVRQFIADRNRLERYREVDSPTARGVQAALGLAEAAGYTREDTGMLVGLVVAKAFERSHIISTTPDLFADPTEDLSRLLEAS